MTTNDRSPIAGLIMLLLAFLGGAYILRFLWQAISSGHVPGKLGAIHYAWSAQYTVSVVGCILGIAFFIVLGRMGLRFARGSR